MQDIPEIVSNTGSSEMSIVVVMTAITTLLGALGLPQLYKHLTDRSQIKSDAQTAEQVAHLKIQMTKIVTSVSMLIIIIQDEFEDSKNIQGAIEKVRDQLESIQKLNDETNSNPNEN